MSDEAELQARIAELSSRIYQQKSGAVPQRGYYNARRPYGRGSPPGRIFPGVQKPGFRHRTLVNNTNISSPTTNSSRDTTPIDPSGPLLPGVTTRDRSRIQWTAPDVYDQKAEAKKIAMEETAAQKRKEKADRQTNRVLNAVYGTTSPTTSVETNGLREMIVNDLRFRVATNGTKLIRIFEGKNENPQNTPKETRIAGVKFVRTKTGNLVRHGLLKVKRNQGNNFKKSLCPDFSTTGSCIRGDRCRFKHDLTKLAICKEYLRSGQCFNGEDCNLSHDLTANRIPLCTHFLRGNCTKPDCRYLHIHVDLTAPVCKDFARLGYCENGTFCPERHVLECPEYSNTGTCHDKKCRLPHIDRAGTLRKAAALKGGNKNDNNDDEQTDDLSSDEEDYQEIDSDDANSEDMEDDIIMAGSINDTGVDLGGQQDFVSF